MFWNILFLFLGIILGFLIFQLRSVYFISKKSKDLLSPYFNSINDLLSGFDRSDDDGTRNC